MSNLLYFPYINVPRTDWTLRTLLYYDNIGSIVPQEYFYEPEQNYDGFMLEMVRSGLVTPINPIDVLDNPWESTRPFIELIHDNRKKLKKAQKRFLSRHGRNIHSDKFPKVNIHADKFDQEIFYQLEQLGLAERSEGNWYSVEKKTANNLMNFLATLISAKTDRLPATDYVKPFYYRNSFKRIQRKRETILAGLIPFPEELDLNRLLRFKEKHPDLLQAFRTQVELIALDPKIIEGTPLFYERLAELSQRKEELSARLNESKFKGILFGTVCGLIGAYQGIASAYTTGTILGALPGFASAVYSALQIERVENIFDQSGLKYLALADKKLRK